MSGSQEFACPACLYTQPLVQGEELQVCRECGEHHSAQYLLLMNFVGPMWPGKAMAASTGR
jgi:hypothetical protein